MKIIFSWIAFVLCSISAGAQSSEVKALYTYSKFPIGASVSIKSLRSDSIYKAFVKAQFNSITAENCMKMKQLLISKDNYHWDDADYLIQYCQANKIRIHGHTLLWHQSVPSWIVPDIDSSTLEQIVKKYITTVVGRYRGKVASWDVVNEVFQDAKDSLRQSIWLKKLGKGFIARAFTYAHQADPEAKLFYNDFFTEAFESKNEALVRLLDELKSQNIPVHGVGFQMHINVAWPDSAVISKHVHKVVNRGYLIHFSELDVDNNNEKRTVYSDSFAIALSNRYRAIADIYKSIPEAQQFGITFWNVTDKDTWLKSYFKRKYEWPLLFNEQYQRKKAFDGFVKGLSTKR